MIIPKGQIGAPSGNPNNEAKGQEFFPDQINLLEWSFDFMIYRGCYPVDTSTYSVLIGAPFNIRRLIVPDSVRVWAQESKYLVSYNLTILFYGRNNGRMR